MLSLGLRYMLMSALGFALMSACVKLAHATGIPVLEIVAARAAVSIFLSYLDIRRKNISLFGRHKALLLARGAVGAIALMAVYTAITTLPLAEATMLQYTHPVFVAVLALLFLRERFSGMLVLSVIASFAGVIFVVQPQWLFAEQGAALSNYGVMMALLGAFGSAIAYVLVRKLSTLEDSSVIIFYFPLIALPLSLVFLGSDFVWPDSGFQWLLLLLVGVFTQIGQIGLTKAMQTEPAARATAFSYIQVLFAVLLGVLFFNELPDLSAWLGVGLILLGALINVASKSKQ